MMRLLGTFALAVLAMADVSNESPGASDIPVQIGPIAIAYYDADARTWVRVAGSWSHTQSATAICSDKILFVWSTAVSDAESMRVFDLRAKCWSSVPHPPIEKRSGFGAATMGSCVAVWGGFQGMSRKF